MTQTKIQRLMAIKEEFARTQAALANARKLEESAEPTGLATLLENDLDQAELILAAQDMMHKLQNMAEDLAKMNAQDLFPLVDKMKAVFGQEASHAFESTAQEAITGAMNTVRHAKDEMGNCILRLEGKMPANDMAASATPDMGASDIATDTGAVDAAMDDFGSADAAAGPDSEPLGRARKESVEGGKALNESVILETAGRKLIETEGLDALIGWVLNEAAAGMPEEHFRSFATSIAQKAAKDPAKLAGWIGKKKHGMAAMAQLAEPTYTHNDQPDLEVMEGKIADKLGKAALGLAALTAVGTTATIAKKGYDYHKGAGTSQMSYSQAQDEKAYQDGIDQLKQKETNEGKTYKRGDDADMDDVKSKDIARKDARKRKGDDKVEEGKTFKHSDDDDDNFDKKSKDIARKADRKRKGDDKVEETVLAARAVAQLIEASIKRENKGNAAKAVKEAVAYLAGQNLVEGDVDLEAMVLEAFTAEYGMRPAAYSVSKLREFMELSSMDKKNGKGALAKMSGAMGADKNAGNKSVQTAMSGMDGVERSAATKMLNKMKQDGDAPKNAGEFAQKAAGMVGDDDAVNENINAAHWPIDSMGQYKGEPMSTDYGKLKPLTGAPKAGKTEGGAPEPKVEEPKVEGSSTPGGNTTKAEKPKGNPFAKKVDEPAEESEDDDSK